MSTTVFTMNSSPSSEPSRRARTCVGCGAREEPRELLRMIVGEGGAVAFDLRGGSFGRGAHVHPREACLAKARGGIARAFRRDPGVDGAELGARLVSACDARMAGLLLSARRLGAVAVGADAALDAGQEGRPGGVLIVASDAGSIAGRDEVTREVARGAAFAWSTKNELGALLGEHAVAICRVRHPAIAAELARTRAYADAGAMAMRKREGTECSRRPEAR